MFRVAPIRDIGALIWMFQKNHPKTFNRDLVAEVECELAQVAEEFSRSLGENAKALYRSLDESRRVAMRICHHLAHYTNAKAKRKKGSCQFFLSTGDLASRIGVTRTQASRIFRSLEELGILKVIRKGEARKGGLATDFEWNLKGPSHIRTHQLPSRDGSFRSEDISSDEARFRRRENNRNFAEEFSGYVQMLKKNGITVGRPRKIRICSVSDVAPN